MKTGKSTVVVHKNSEAKLKKKLIWGVNIYRNLFSLDKLYISMKKDWPFKKSFLVLPQWGLMFLFIILTIMRKL